MRVLVVEDSEILRGSLVAALRRTGYAVDQSADGGDAMWQATSVAYDVMVLDLMLPGLDGLTVLKRLREKGNKTHILVLTARDAIDDRVNGLQAGADDYLVKPFALAELIARVAALARRSAHEKSPLIKVDDITLNTAARTVECGGRGVTLTPREYALLEYLMLRRGSVISRSELETHIYDSLAEPMSNVVDSTICAIRRKIDAPKVARSFIQTRRGMGYVIPGDPS